MTIQLIPVIEITNYGQDIPLPNKSPCWDYPDLWNDFHEKCHKKVGFKDVLKPYAQGNSFYELSEISEGNLTKLVLDATEEMRNNQYDSDFVISFNGGCVLKIDDEDLYFPQCCCDLSDIQAWEQLIIDEPSSFYHGHPSPSVLKQKDTIVFDFVNHSFATEVFSPLIKVNSLEISKNELKQAVEEAKIKLNVFAERVKKVNKAEQLNIEDIDKLLVY
jgi:hypothetical protein